MKLIINDLMQFSDLDDDLQSPSLADRVENTGTITVNFTIPSEYSTFTVFSGVLSEPLSVGASVYDGILSQPLSVGASVYDGVLSQPVSVSGADEFDCLGIGGTDATQLTINGDIVINATGGGAFKDGLYEIGQSITANQITIDHNGTYMGRIAAGKCTELCISPSREPGFFSSVDGRRTLSGQVVEAAGGYAGEVLGVDFRYKIDRDVYTEFQRAYPTQLAKGFPLFLDFNNDDWLPRNKFYGQTNNQLLFQSAINGFLYSRRFEFREAF